MARTMSMQRWSMPYLSADPPRMSPTCDDIE
jgi:hypothetical protein